MVLFLKKECWGWEVEGRSVGVGRLKEGVLGLGG